MSVFITTSSLLAVGMILIPATRLEATGIKIAPLKYEELLELGSHKTGFVDVSNPTDLTITVITEVQAFRQVSSRGDIEFYESEQITGAINIDVEEFELGPREAARIFFTIDSNKLPMGGVYAAVFFTTETSATNPEATSIATSARVGTLLILENGDEGVRDGQIDNLDFNFLQFGDGLVGKVNFSALDNSRYSLAFTPELNSTIPFGISKPVESGLVFAGNNREFELTRRGHYLGLFPIEVSDSITGSSERVWVLAVTGLWSIILPFFLLVLGISIVLQRYFRNH